MMADSHRILAKGYSNFFAQPRTLKPTRFAFHYVVLVSLHACISLQDTANPFDCEQRDKRLSGPRGQVLAQYHHRLGVRLEVK